MRVHYDEGVANRIGPAPCVVGGDASGEASAGESIGQLLSYEKINGDADAVVPAEGNTVLRESASTGPVLRGRRTWHVPTLLAWKPGGLATGSWIGP
ncbi:MAG: hypothetical protein SGJ03_16145 [Alphaproteobacteria bacterium]|nr:hypothetical protein [Alphaproteobacteria bacterium]